eukprot:1592338-Amphidinium_carterae.2
MTTAPPLAVKPRTPELSRRDARVRFAMVTQDMETPSYASAMPARTASRASTSSNRASGSSTSNVASPV